MSGESPATSRGYAGDQAEQASESKNLRLLGQTPSTNRKGLDDWRGTVQFFGSTFYRNSEPVFVGVSVCV